MSLLPVRLTITSFYTFVISSRYNGIKMAVKNATNKLPHRQ